MVLMVLQNENNFCFFSDDEFGERSVSVYLDGVESELVFIDHTHGEMSVSKFLTYFLYIFWITINITNTKKA